MSKDTPSQANHKADSFSALRKASGNMGWLESASRWVVDGSLGLVGGGAGHFKTLVRNVGANIVRGAIFLRHLWGVPADNNQRLKVKYGNPNFVAAQCVWKESWEFSEWENWRWVTTLENWRWVTKQENWRWVTKNKSTLISDIPGLSDFKSL